ncbi:MAG: [Clostridia bacterium]|nr:[FeFe] hydrogenase H-cluster maturation GTPase HydF [Clostridia bacterium]
MEKTPLSMRKNIAIFGETNAGKSSLFNALLGQDMSIVSEISGTTTDPVIKAMELIPYGPVTLIDTAGLGDSTALGERRMEKSRDVLDRCDLVIYVKDINKQVTDMEFGKLPVIKVYTKCDIADRKTVEALKSTENQAVFISDYTEEGLLELREKMISELRKQERDDETLLGKILPCGSTVVLVIPIDEAAPKGRIILPQVQTIRDCLDHGIKAVCVTPKQLTEVLSELKKVDLVITDSQAFAEVSKMVPQDVYLTSFSMLLANQKGRIHQLIEGTYSIKNLKDGDEILMLEACTHSTTHDDIGKVKIPALLQKKTGKQLKFTHLSGYDFPKDLQRYSLVIQCGGCMVNKKAIQTRLDVLKEQNIPVTNYGVVLAYLSGILDRASKILLDN